LIFLVASTSAAPPTAVVRLPYDDLRERRLFSLSVRGRADEDVDFAGRMDADDGALPQTALEADRAGHL
jgi:hypothetical protein